MSNDLHFDVAFSYAKPDGWIARDLYNLIVSSGLSVYCYERTPDAVAGFLRSQLLDIYRSSRMNVVLWSRAYAEAGQESLPAMERRLIVNRHVEKGSAESLFVLRVDDEPLRPDIETVLTHDIRDQGLLRSARLVSERIRALSTQATDIGRVEHPIGTEAARGPLRPCQFQIAPDYQSDVRGRWRRLGDVLVTFSSPVPTEHVYLIPSGACSPLLRHSDILRTDPGLLDRKRKATAEFCHSCGAAPVDGFWFTMRKGEIEFAAIYAPRYDAALNESLKDWQ
jgi:hypothetical protein